MSKRYFCSTILVGTIVCIIFIEDALLTSACTEPITSLGTEFMIAIDNTLSRSDMIFLHIASATTEAKVRVNSPYLHFDQNYTVVSQTRIAISPYVQLATHYASLQIRADVPISLNVVHNSKYDGIGGYMALPIQSLSTRYMLSSYRPTNSDASPNYGTEFDVTGIYNNSVYRRVGGISFSKSDLDRFQSEGTVCNCEANGTFITSDKPVAVISSTYESLEVWHHSPYHFVEQMITIKFLGNKYIIPPLYPRTNYIIRISSASNNTRVNLYNSTHHEAVDVGSNDLLEVVCGSDPMVVIADKPVSVMQYGYNDANSTRYKDQLMITAQSVFQFRHMYRFATDAITNSNRQSTDVTIAITIKTTDYNYKLLLQDSSLDQSNLHQFSVAYPMQEYVVLLMNVSFNEFYTLEHGGYKPFGLILYAFLDSFTAYGYPVAMNFTSGDCYPPESTTKQIATTATTTTRTTLASYGNGTLCFECSGMSHLKYCDKVTTCSQLDQICFVQRYDRSGVQMYRSGCIGRKNCHSFQGQSSCMACCEGNFCNTAGCGDQGINGIANRGPMCFDCSHRGESDSCKNVLMCAPNERCMIEKYKWGGNDFLYSQGCSQSCGFAKRSADVDRKMKTRNLPVCTHCCSTDFCNSNCTETPSPAIVG